MTRKTVSRKSLLLLVILVAVLVSVIPALAAGNPSANGGGTTTEFGETSTFVFNAVEHKDGSVNGHLVYQFRAGDLSIHMNIDCLSIVGNQATLSGTATSVTGNTAAYPWVTVGGHAVFTVVDNGQGSAASPDLISDVIFGAGANCGTSVVPPYLPISGNLQVNS